MLTISVVIHNPDPTIWHKFLKSIKNHTGNDILSQIIVVDNASKDNVWQIKLFDMFPNRKRLTITPIKLKENVGFGKAHNIALAKATGKYFAVLNDDIEFNEEWAEKMIHLLESDHKIGQVCLRKGQCNNLGIRGEGFYQDTDIDTPEYAEGSCFMMHTEIAKKFKLFDESYEFAYCEDVDLSLRLRKEGYIIKSIDIGWKHHRAVTSSKIDKFMRYGYEAKNRQLLRLRWQPYLLTKNFNNDSITVVKRTGSIGDVYLSLPIVEALKEKYPNTAIVYQTQTPQLIENNPIISAITDVGYPIPYDRMINLDDAYEENPNLPLVDCFAEKAGVKIKRKYSTVCIPQEDIITIDNFIPHNFGRFILLDLSDTWPAKQWEQWKYAELADKLRRHGYKIVTFGLVQKSIPIKVKYDLDFSNILDVMLSCALLTRASLYIGHEGMLAHVAQSMKMPTVILYGCNTPEICNDMSLKNFRPVRSPIPCQGCRTRQKGNGVDCPIAEKGALNYPCMQSITVDMVYQTCAELIDVLNTDAAVSIKLTDNSIESDLSGSADLQKDIIQAILPERYQEMSMIDIGCETAKVTKTLPFKDRLFVDMIPPANGEVPEPFYKGNAIELLEKAEKNKYDILFALDFIEHLKKDEGYHLLDLCEEKIGNTIIIFTPLGELAVSNPDTEEYHPHRHWSGWLPEEFHKRGYETAIFPQWHNPWEDGKVHGAFFAWKNKNNDTKLKKVRGIL